VRFQAPQDYLEGWWDISIVRASMIIVALGVVGLATLNRRFVYFVCFACFVGFSVDNSKEHL
jgi:hypothetical protein